MAERGYVVVLYDAPDDEAFQSWLHGPHYREILDRTPGVRAVTRLEVLDPAPGQQRYVALIQTDDLAATLAWRDSAEGQRAQADANAGGLRNRAGFAARIIYEAR